MSTRVYSQHFVDPSTITGLTSAKADLLLGRNGGGLDSLSVGTDGQVLIAQSADAKGIVWGTPTAGVHSSSHILGAADEIDGDRLAIDFTPTKYVPATTGETSDVKELTSHLKGIDDALQNNDQFIELTDTPAAYTGANRQVLAVNAGADAVEFSGIEVGTSLGTNSVAFGTGSAAAGTSAAAYGASASAPATNSVAIGANAVARLENTHHVAGLSLLRKATGDSATIPFSSEVICLATGIVDLTTTDATVTLTIPTGASFFPDQIDIIQLTTGTADATLQFGDSSGSNDTKYGTVSQGNAAAGDRQSLTGLPDLGAPTNGVLQVKVSVGDASAGTCRVVWRGMLLENE